MNKLLFLIAFLPQLVSAQNLPINNEGKIEYSEVVFVDSASAAKLFSRAKLFIADRSKEVILDDKDANQILGKGSFTIWDTSARLGKTSMGIVNYKLLIQCKDGRYRYFITEFFHEFYTPVSNNNLSGGALENEKPVHPLSPEAFAKVKARTNDHVKLMVADLKTFMAAKPSKDDW